MKKCVLLLTLLLFSWGLSAQKNIQKYYDGILYYKLKDDVQIERKSSKSVDFRAELPYLKKVSEDFSIKRVERPFYFSQSRSMDRTYRVFFDNADKTTEFMHYLQSLKFVEYVERAPYYYSSPQVELKASDEELNSTRATANDPYYGDASSISLQGGATLIYGNKWFLDQIEANAAWDIFMPKASVKVAVVDGAVFGEHEDLNVTDQYDAEDGELNSSPPDGAADAYSWSHGTHCAGLIGAVTNNGTGIASVGHNLEIVGVKTADDATGDLYYVWDGLLWAIESGAKVVSMSLGSYSYSITAQNIINEAFNKDILVLAAAANDNITEMAYPAAYEHVMSVGSVSADDKKSDFSNFGTWVDIMAPGGNLSGSMYLLLSTTYCSSSNSGMGIAANTRTINGNQVAGNYHMMAGTSMATPVAAGLAGLIRSANPNLSAAQVEAVMKVSADDISANNALYNGMLGAGRINARRALEFVANAELLSIFKSDQTIINPKEAVSFTDLSLGNITNWEWQFEGGTPATSTEQNPVVVYDLAGDFDVSLTVSDGTNSKTYILENMIHVGTRVSVEIQHTGFAAPSRGIDYISVVDDQIVWASAYDGTNSQNYIRDFTRTRDGGESWVSGVINVDAGLVPAMIHGIDASTAYTAMWSSGTGDQGIYKTTDAGQTWVRQTTAEFTAAGAFPNVVYFWDENYGVCQGDPTEGYFELYITSDGGQNWTRVPNTDGVLAPSASDEYGTVGYFAVGDDESFFYNTNKGRVFRTLDKGQTWEVFNTPVAEGNKIAFSNANNGIVTDIKNDKAYYTVDGGQSWQPLNYTGTFFKTSLHYIPGSGNSFVSSSADYEKKAGLSVSHDGGENWEMVPELDDVQSLHIGFHDLSLGWIGAFNQDVNFGGMYRYDGPSLIADFDGDAEEICLANSVVFEDKSVGTNNASSYEWDFGVGAEPATATTPGPHTVTYSEVGTKVVSLLIDKTYTVTTNVVVNQVPTIGSISAADDVICGGSSTVLTLDEFTGNLQWQWSAAEDGEYTGENADEVNPYEFETNVVSEKTYFRAAAISGGCETAYSNVVLVDISPITAAFSTDEGRLTVQFTDMSENAVSYNWSFGDGGSSEEANPEHTYTAAAEYTVKQFVTSDVGCMDSTEQVVSVYISGIESGFETRIATFPNPATDVLSVEWDNELNISRIQLISTTGSLIKTIDTKAGQVSRQISVKELNTGVYILKLISPDFTVVRKITKN